jgi:hypothetical protein
MPKQFGLRFADLVLRTSRRLGDFLARAVLPQMEWADEDDWQQLLGWLQEVRDVGVFPTVVVNWAKSARILRCNLGNQRE